MIDDNKPNKHALVSYADSVNDAIAILFSRIKNLEKRVKELEDHDMIRAYRLKEKEK